MNNICIPHVDSLANLYAGIERYYTQKVLTHGPTAHGVDWGCIPTQELRFVQLLKICDFSTPFSLNDLGCGYGAMLGFLRKRHRRSRIDYLGIDVSPAMIDAARPIWHRHHRSAFALGSTIPRIADYSVASGIFNVKQDESEDSWTYFIERTLADLRTASRSGFAVNFLTPLSYDTTMKHGLYRVLPQRWLLYCEKNFNATGQIIENYGMKEFTLLIRY